MDSIGGRDESVKMAGLECQRPTDGGAQQARRLDVGKRA